MSKKPSEAQRKILERLAAGEPLTISNDRMTHTGLRASVGSTKVRMMTARALFDRRWKVYIIGGKTMVKFEIGQRVRVKEDAFPGSGEPADVAARGETGELVAWFDYDLWQWRNDDGSITYPFDSELELVEQVTP